MKKKIAVLLSMCMLGSTMMVGCGTETTAEAETESLMEETEVSTETTTQNDKEILVVSFGTSYESSRELTIGAIENAIAEAYPDYTVCRAFTSQTIIDKLKEQDNIEIDNVEEALERAIENGVKTLIIQPTHFMSGYEYTDLSDILAEYADAFDQIALGAPLLTSDEDFKAVEAAITEVTAEYDDGNTAIVFMGHGTEADSNGVYSQMQELLTADGYENYYVGTVEATPSLDDVIEALKDKGYTRVVLRPFMVVAGDHANNDMAGDEEDSWKTILTNEGYDVECVLEGLGQVEAIQQIYVAHTQDAIDSLSE